ncbi:hypothetical protein HZA43_01510 [Candidatus Peregrinibacteria bacterium]|nr:hypothetical protein [Candidatus Peregrinibacteria bacterium]
MNPPSSLFTKIAAFLFLLGSFGSLMNFVNALLPLIADGASSGSDGLRSFADQLLPIIIAPPMAVLSFLTGWFLVKLKRWAYILGLAMAILALVIFTLLSLRAGEIAYLELAEAIVILILLIAGRKDFRKA